MALFEFRLKELPDVLPWGEGEDLRLHWFGLTDGIYYLNVGNAQLFRYSDEIIKHWQKAHPEVKDNDVYVDYQVVRLHEDLLEMLSNILQPVPDEVLRFIKTESLHREWAESLWSVYQSTEDEETMDTYLKATEWLDYYRSISTMHLNQGPTIWMWSTDTDVHIRWNNESNKIDGIQLWSTVKGDFSLSLEAFRYEVQSFHDRLMLEMSHRIEQLKTNNPIPNVNIDMPLLEKEQHRRTQSLYEALEISPNVSNWSGVIEAINKLKPNNISISLANATTLNQV